MQLDRKMLNRILNMNDEQLGEVIERLARESGIDPVMLGLDPKNLQSIRQALASANDADIEQLNTLYHTYRQDNRRKS